MNERVAQSVKVRGSSAGGVLGNAGFEGDQGRKQMIWKSGLRGVREIWSHRVWKRGKLSLYATVF